MSLLWPRGPIMPECQIPKPEHLQSPACLGSKQGWV